MECNKCGITAFIDNKKLVFQGDKSADEETKAFYEQTYVCRNPQCGMFGKEVGTQLVELD